MEAGTTAMNHQRTARLPFGRGMARSRRHRSRGQTLVEFALVFPIFVVLMAGIADFGFGLYQYMNVINAARIGARFGIISPANALGIQNAAQSAGIGSTASVASWCWSVTANGGTTTPTTSPGSAGWELCSTTGVNKPTTGDTIAVNVSLPYGYLWPVRLHAGVVNVDLFTAPITLASTLQMKIE
jgi:Flp pilus assembly protein TadG